MIDWWRTTADGLWLAGLAAMLAALSRLSYTRRIGSARGGLLDALHAHLWLRAGAVVFCAGRALSGRSWVESGLWALAGLFLAGEYLWTRPRSPAGPPLTQTERATARGKPAGRLGTAAAWLVDNELFVLALLLPVVLFPLSSGVGLVLLLVLPALWLLRRAVRGHFVPPTPLDWALCLLLAGVLVSTFATFDLRVSAERITLLVYGIAVLYALAARGGTGRRLAWLLAGYAVAGLALAVGGLLGAQWPEKLPLLGAALSHLPGVLRGLANSDTGFNPNILGGAMLLVAPVQLAFLGWAWARPAGDSATLWGARLGLLPAVLITATTIGLSQSRGAVLGFGVAVILLLWLAGRGGRLALGLAVLIAVAAVLYIGPQVAWDRVTTEAGAMLSTTDSLRSAHSRLEIWARALTAIRDFPLTGIGMGTFSRLLPVLYPLSADPGGPTINHAHNQFLQAGLDLGIAGLVAYVALWLLAAALLVQTWRRVAVSWHRAATAGIAAALAGLLVFGMTDTVVFVAKPGIFFWALLGLLVALHRQASLPRPGPAAAFASAEAPGTAAPVAEHSIPVPYGANEPPAVPPSSGGAPRTRIEQREEPARPVAVRADPGEDR